MTFTAMTHHPDLLRIAIHGGAGDLPDGADDREYRSALAHILAAAQAQLSRGASAVDVVENAVAALEDCPLFNAGTGAVLNADGLPELDAAIMDGASRRAGALAAVSRLKNPVRAARLLLEHGPPVLLAGAGAERYAVAYGITPVDPHSLITAERRQQLLEAQRAGRVTLDHDDHGSDDASGASAGFGTVGAVARDGQGRLAAATSTGGLTNKHAGRVGDAPVIGAGTYADDRSLAISCTGTGESFIRVGYAHLIHARLLYQDEAAPGTAATLPHALERYCRDGLDELAALGGRGGCIAIDRHGRMSLPCNTRAMFRAWAAADGQIHVAVRADEGAPAA